MVNLLEVNNLKTPKFNTIMTHLEKNQVLMEVIKKSPELNIPNWHVGAGVIANTIWNSLTEKPVLDGIKDIDWVYFDGSDLSEDSERKTINLVKAYFSDIPIKLDIKNQARVHLWYEEKFGYNIKPYQNIHHAIDTWPTTSTTIALKYDRQNGLQHYSTYGFSDALNLTVRANKAQITEEIYMKKVERWKKKWPELTIIPW